MSPLNEQDNRLQQIINSDTTSYLYDETNRLESVAGQNYSFDANGNLLATGVMTNTWDAANRLVETAVSSQQLGVNYDGLGNRVAQTAGGNTTYFALDVVGLPEVIQTSEGNSYLHLPGVIVAESAGGEVRYLLSDGLGSVRQAVDETGAVVSYHEFDPYGNPIHPSSFIPHPFGYTGEWWEDEVGLLHLRARWYLPETGTFLSRDPVVNELSYQYVKGNPVNFIDPSGYQEREPGVCDDWSGPIKGWCLTANDSSLGYASLLAIENFYRMLVWGNRVHFGWDIAANLLDHYLDGTAGDTPDDVPGPGSPFFIYDRKWVLSTENDRVARKILIDEFVNDHIRPVVDSCKSGPIRAYLQEPEIDPPPSTEVKNSIGEHTMQVVFEAWVDYGDSFFVADATANFFIEDKYDFDPDRAIVYGHPLSKYGVGTVPHDWLVDLAIAHWAAEFQVHVLWQEKLSITGSTSSTMFKVDLLR